MTFRNAIHILKKFGSELFRGSISHFSCRNLFGSKAAGFTLLEVMVALGILGTLIAISSMTLVQNLRENMNSQKRYEAIQAAQTVMDKIRFEDISTLSGPRTETVTIGGRVYSVMVLYCQIPSYCISDAIRHITLRVMLRSKKIYETDTVFSKLS